ncbi:MAG: hypothetical protein E7399_03010 [Ruminococcaceae bacterium]|nr:hypothetical protein [Oscillospiraceae bacterium]
MNLEFLSGLGLEEEICAKILEEYQRECDKSAFSDTLQKQLEQAGAKSVKAVSALLDQEGLTFEEGEISGLSEQLTALKEAHPYLFETDLPRAVASTMGGGERERSLFSVIRSAAGL